MFLLFVLVSRRAVWQARSGSKDPPASRKPCWLVLLVARRRSGWPKLSSLTVKLHRPNSAFNILPPPPLFFYATSSSSLLSQVCRCGGAQIGTHRPRPGFISQVQKKHASEIFIIIHFICIALFRKFKDTLWGIKIIKSVHIKLQMNPNAGVHKITRTQTNLKEIEDGAVYVMKGQVTQDNSSNV